LTGRAEGKVALVTGAARGQGRSHAVSLAREGADIIAVDICANVASVPAYPLATPDDLAETAAMVKELGRQIVARQVDVRDRSDLISVVNEAVTELGHLDIVVANAGVVAVGPDSSVDSFIDTIAINLGGVFNTVEAAFSHLRAGASIIVTGSYAALMRRGGTSTQAAGPGGAGYTHAKRGVARYVHDLAWQLAPLSIRVNAVHPGNVETMMLLNDGMYKVFRPDLQNPTREDAEPAFRAMHRIPTTYIQPQDISNAVVFLASDESRFITGQQIKVEAGGLLNSTISGVPDGT
jgi:SDR family mycofactocin-dependent oxidoreductase